MEVIVDRIEEDYAVVEIDKGKLIREILKQPKSQTVSTEGQVALFICINNGIFDGIELSKIQEVQDEVVALMEEDFVDMVKTIRSNEKLSEDQIKNFISKATETVKKYKNVE